MQEAIDNNTKTTVSITDRLSKLLADPQASFDTWNTNFLKSLDSQVKAGRKLSDKQIAYLEKIETNFFTKPLVDENWSKEYFDSKRADAIEVASWLKAQALVLGKPFYHQNFVSRVLTSPTYVPTKESYAVAVENKFSQRFLKIRKTPPRFTPSNFVTFEAGSILRNCLVISVIPASKLPFHANFIAGCHEYTLLEFGKMNTFTVAEKYLRPFKIKKDK